MTGRTAQICGRTVGEDFKRALINSEVNSGGKRDMNSDRERARGRASGGGRDREREALGERERTETESRGMIGGKGEKKGK